MDSTSSSLMFRTPHKTTSLLDRSWQWTHPSRLFRVAQPLLPTYVFDVRGAIPSGIQNPLSKNPWPGCIGNSMTTGALGAHLIGSTFPFWRWKISKLDPKNLFLHITGKDDSDGGNTAGFLKRTPMDSYGRTTLKAQVPHRVVGHLRRSICVSLEGSNSCKM